MSNVANPPPSSGRLPLLQSTDYQPPVIRKALESISEMQTAFIQLSPAFFAALQSIAPKKRRGQVRYVIAAALLVFVGAILLDGSTRSFLVERGHALALKVRAPAARPELAAPPGNEALPPNAMSTVAPPATPVVDAPAAAPAAAAGDAPVAPAAATGNPTVAKPTTKATNARTPAPAKRNTRKSTRAPRLPAQPQMANAPIVLAARDSDGF